METVVLDGVQYVKASVIAKRFRYTSDYIGQLCRGRKVDARLVGRTWFVNPASVEEHKQKKFQKLEDEVDTVDSVVPQHPVARKVSVEPVIGAKTAKRVAASTNAHASGERHLKVQYEKDEEALMPTIHKKVKQPPKRLRIEHVDPKRVKVSGGRKKSDAHFAPTELPEIALSGKLKVNRMEEPDELAANDSDITKENKAISEKSDKNGTSNDNEMHLKAKLKGRAKEEVELHVFKGDVLPPLPATVSNHGVEHRSEKTLPLRKTNSNSPARMRPASFTPRSVNIARERSARTSVWVRTSPLLATLIAVIAVLGIFAASSQVAASGDGYDSTIVFQIANLIELMNR